MRNGEKGRTERRFPKERREVADAERRREKRTREMEGGGRSGGDRGEERGADVENFRKASGKNLSDDVSVFYYTDANLLRFEKEMA